ncbi:MAG TPA: hypothetical protein VFT57_04645 [Gemmatimonadaceae bacterium]|jgi:hypothetical protein|nr:hypothetical protein [Gemmatimonadaceae bacterium]HEU6450686.1 hypothetical protein [Gemmatimonadaceae bacterium]
MAKNRKSRDDERRADSAREAENSTRRDERESGMPGGGAGRRDAVGRTGVYPQSASERPSSDAPVRTENAWGQGERGAAGYEDSGTSELASSEEIKRRIEHDRQSASSRSDDETHRSSDEQRSSRGRRTESD